MKVKRPKALAIYAAIHERIERKQVFKIIGNKSSNFEKPIKWRHGRKRKNECARFFFKTVSFLNDEWVLEHSFEVQKPRRFICSLVGKCPPNSLIWRANVVGSNCPRRRSVSLAVLIITNTHTHTHERSSIKRHRGACETEMLCLVVHERVGVASTQRMWTCWGSKNSHSVDWCWHALTHTHAHNNRHN